MDDFTHVKAEATKHVSKGGNLLRMEDFLTAIRERYPDFDKYYWRHRPSREEHREFETNDTTIRFYARFSVPKNGAAKRAADVTTSRTPADGVYGFGKD